MDAVMSPFKLCTFWVFLCIFHIRSYESHSLETEFLDDFFKGKNVAVTIHSCWKSEKSIELMRHISRRTASIRILTLNYRYTQFDINAAKQISNNNYLVLDIRNCMNSELILDIINATQMFYYPLKFLILTTEEHFRKLQVKFSGYAILPSSEVVVAKINSRAVIFGQPYRVHMKSELIWENYGNWTKDSGLFENFNLLLPTQRRRYDLRGTHLNVGLVMFDNDSWNHLTDYRYPGVDTFLKQDYETMRCVFDDVNITYTLSAIDNFGYYHKETGEYDGVVRLIHDGKIDVTGCSLYMTEDRFDIVDFIKMGNPLIIQFIVRKPSTSYIKNIFYLTFTTKVWIAIIVVMIIFAIIIRIILNWETKFKQALRQEKYSASDVTLMALEAVCQQGTTTEPHSISGRVSTVIFFGALMFVYVSYSANIVVLLQSTTEIKNLQELLDSRIEVGGWNIHYMRGYMESAKEGVLKELYDKKIGTDGLYPEEVGLKKLQDGNFAYHVVMQLAYQYILSTFTNYEICTLQELPGYVYYTRGYVAIRKLSPYKDLFKIAKISDIQRIANPTVMYSSIPKRESFPFPYYILHTLTVKILYSFIDVLSTDLTVPKGKKMLSYYNDLMQVSIGLLKLSGLNPAKQRVELKFWAGLMCFILAVLIVMAFIYEDMTFERCSDVIVTVFMLNHVVIKYVLALVKREPMNEFLQNMENYWPLPETHAEAGTNYSNLAILKYSRWLFTFLDYYVSFLLCGMSLSSVFGSGLPFECYHPVSISYNYSILINALFLLSIYPSVIGVDMFLASLIILLWLQFRILNETLTKFYCKGNECEVRNLALIKECVEHHNFLLSQINKFNGTFGSVLLVFLWNEAALICFELVILSSSEGNSSSYFVKLIAVPIIVVLELLTIYCIPMQLLADETGDIAKSVYLSEWCECSHGAVKKSLLIIMTKSQKKFIFAGNLFPINLESCKHIFQTSFSFFTFMRRLN